jgi:hypothetical protein
MHLVLQQKKSALPLSNYGVQNGGFVINGGWLKAGIDTVQDESIFYDATALDIEEGLRSFFTSHPELGDTDTTEIVILDIESPVHPRTIHQLLDTDQAKFDATVAGYILRAAVARTVLPQAELGVYFTFTGPLSGTADDAYWADQREAWRIIAERGLFDHLDLLVPVFYLRYGPTDTRYDRYGDHIRLGVDDGRTYRRTDGTALPLFPLGSFRVYNGGSNHSGELALDFDPTLDDTCGLYAAIMADKQVARFGYWDGGDELGPPNPNGWTKLDYFQLLTP